MNAPRLTRLALLAVAVLALASTQSRAVVPETRTAGGPASGSAVREIFFDSDWTRQGGDVLVDIPTPPSVSEPGDDRRMYAQHELPAHASITRLAYELYAARQGGGGELGAHIADVLAGAHDEDGFDMTPWGDWIPMMRHFWDCRKGPFKGLGEYDSSVNRAQKYFTGGYGLDGKYDARWSGNLGRHRGVKGQGILYLYAHGDKHKAFWYLGHAAHLLEDLTVPAHALLWPHPFNGDAYEHYMGSHYAEWPALPQGPLERFDSLYDLFYQTAGVANRYDAGLGSGPLAGADGTADRGTRRSGGFTEKKLREEGDVLMPLAYRRVAALFLFFTEQVRNPQ
jgi:hypothetical protein